MPSLRKVKKQIKMAEKRRAKQLRSAKRIFYELEQLSKSGQLRYVFQQIQKGDFDPKKGHRIVLWKKA